MLPSFPAPLRPGGAAAFWGRAKPGPKTKGAAGGQGPWPRLCGRSAPPPPPPGRCGLLRPPGPSFPATPPAPLRFPALSWPILSRSSPGTASISYTPYAFPHPFPSVTRHTPKAFWKPPKAVSKAVPFAALGEAPLAPFATLGEAHAPSALHFRPATSQGSGGGAAPSRGSRGAAAPGLGGANITKYLLPNPYRNLHLSPYLHIKRPPLGAVA